MTANNHSIVQYLIVLTKSIGNFAATKLGHKTTLDFIVSGMGRFHRDLFDFGK